jgi:hypothetical protein
LHRNVGWQFFAVEQFVKQIVIYDYIHVRKYEQHALHTGTDLSSLGVVMLEFSPEQTVTLFL